MTVRGKAFVVINFHFSILILYFCAYQILFTWCMYQISISLLLIYSASRKTSLLKFMRKHRVLVAYRIWFLSQWTISRTSTWIDKVCFLLVKWNFELQLSFLFFRIPNFHSWSREFLATTSGIPVLWCHVQIRLWRRESVARRVMMVCKTSFTLQVFLSYFYMVQEKLFW